MSKSHVHGSWPGLLALYVVSNKLMQVVSNLELIFLHTMVWVYSSGAFSWVFWLLPCSWFLKSRYHKQVSSHSLKHTLKLAIVTTDAQGTLLLTSSMKEELKLLPRPLFSWIVLLNIPRWSLQRRTIQILLHWHNMSLSIFIYSLFFFYKEQK